MKRGIQKIAIRYKKVVLPIQDTLASLELSGMLLLGTTIIALIIANSTFGEAFLHFWHMEVEFHFGDFKTQMDLHAFINDGLMTLFFVVVGGEIKREIVEGALSTKEKAILPVIGALGGMLFPAIFYTMSNLGQETASGWGIPMATDIAFSLTIISFLGKRVPFSLKIFLAALAIADDLGAIVVIALFYSSNLDVAHLMVGFGIIGFLVLLNYAGVQSLRWYVIGALALWYFFFMAGIHPTIAGVVLAMVVPYRIPNYEQVFDKNLKEVQSCVAMLSDPKADDKLIRGQVIEKMQVMSTKMEAPLHNLLVSLHSISSYFIMPLFAFSNAGVVINSDAFSTLLSPLSIGIISGLMLGKSFGIVISCWAAVKFKIASLPSDLNWKLLYGMAWLAGIGFTMSMFVTGLAFDDIYYIDTAKISILLASFLSGLIGYVYLFLTTKPIDDLA